MPCCIMRYYHMFPCAIPHRRADYPRVTHPSAASRPEGLFARLACLKRAASVRSEPGSNSPSFNPLALGKGLFTCSLSCLHYRTGFFYILCRSCSELTEAPLLLSSSPSLISVKNLSMPLIFRLPPSSLRQLSNLHHIAFFVNLFSPFFSVFFHVLILSSCRQIR